jgi:Fur family transcriptional regulator, ferric uptake regulator
VRRRDDVLAALRAHHGFLSAQQIHARLRSDGASIGLATVYRLTRALSAAGEIDVVRAEDGEARYRACRSAGHHHHLVCRDCGRTEELEADVVERWARTVAEEHGFTAADHVVEIVGTCRTCSTPPGT